MRAVFYLMFLMLVSINFSCTEDFVENQNLYENASGGDDEEVDPGRESD